MLSSLKGDTIGLRPEIFRRFKDKMACFGWIVGKVLDEKYEAIAPYHYTIATENCQIDDYFSEKIIDCFTVGTVPIYWGTKNVFKYFNMDGVIQVDGIDDVARVIENLREPDSKMKDAILDNFERSVQYRCTDDWIMRNHSHIFE
jgi:hypothetical protein